MGLDGYNEDYSDSIKLQTLAKSLEGKTIKTAGVKEHGLRAVVELKLEDGRFIDIGAGGALHDEAYLIFREHEDRAWPTPKNPAPKPIDGKPLRFTSVCRHCRDSIESVSNAMFWLSYEDHELGKDDAERMICDNSVETGHHEADINEAIKLE